MISVFKEHTGSSLVTQWGKDLALSLLWAGSLLWLRFHPWPGNFRMPGTWPKKKKKKKKKKAYGYIVIATVAT